MQVMKKRKIALSVGWSVILAIVVLLQSLPVSPVYNHLEADSGVYAYVGSAILDGQLPYRDVWEQKPPVGFYLDALALLFGHTPWAIWWLNVIWVSLTCIVFFLLIKKMMGGIAACLASLLFAIIVMYPQLFQGGNLMEVFGLLFQVLVIGAAFSFFATSQNYWVFPIRYPHRIGFSNQADYDCARFLLHACGYYCFAASARIQTGSGASTTFCGRVSYAGRPCG